MSNRKILLVWTLLTIFAGVGRQWAVGYHEQWISLFAENKEKYVEVAEAARELKQRRQDLAVGDGEEFVQTKLRELAFDVSLADLTITEAKPTGGRTHIDNKFTIEFPRDKGVRRSQISAFLYNAESQLTRMRTVNLELLPFQVSGRAPETGAERADQWKVIKVMLQRRTPKKDS